MSPRIDYITSPSGVTVAKAIADQWHEATFPTVVDSMVYHLAKHGKGRTIAQYTKDAMDFFHANRALAQPVTLKSGAPGLKISVGKGKHKKGGYWTQDGKLVTFWD